MIKFINKKNLNEMDVLEKHIDSNLNNETKCFIYIDEVIELISQIQNNTDYIINEEGNITYGLNNLLKGTEYTTNQTEKVNEYLQVLSKNSDKTENLVTEVFSRRVCKIFVGKNKGRYSK